MTTDKSALGRSKHILVKIWYVRNHVTAGSLAVTYLSTDKMTADLLTKPLQRTMFFVHASTMLGMKHSGHFKTVKV